MKPVALVRIVVVFVLASLLAVAFAVVVAAAQPAPATATSYNANPPPTPVKLIFIHHSTGENWLNDAAELGIALRDNNYFVSDTNYGWGPADVDRGSGTIGDNTDIQDWYTWFTGPHRDTYLAALYAESGQHASYSRLASDPGGENTIIMFKSCFPNSQLDGNPNDPPAASADLNSPLDVAHAKRIYLDLLPYFAAHQNKLFVVITAPPLSAESTDAAHAANARAFNNWLVDTWRSGYAYHNVAVFDFYTVLTSNGGDIETNDLGAATGNHHRYRNGVIEHTTTQGGNTSAYANGGDSHPSLWGNLKATGEYLPLLNIAWHCWHGDGSCSGGSTLSISKSVALTHNPALPGDPITYTIVVHNSTMTDTLNVRLTDTLPSGVVGTNLDTTRTISGNNAVTITLPAVVAANVSSGAAITNTAAFTHTSGGGQASAVFNVSTLLPDLSTSRKTVNAATVAAGGLITFTIRLTNTGTAQASVRYTDTLPSTVDWVSGNVTGTVSVNAGAATLRTIVARAKRDLSNGMRFTNTVVLNDGLHAAFNRSAPGVTVQAPDLSGSQRLQNKSTFNPGETITYTLRLINSGALGANARYTVTLPAEVITPTGALSGTLSVNAGATVTPTVIVAQIRSGLAAGTAFQARVNINDGYHTVYTLSFPAAAIGTFQTALPLMMNGDPESSLIINHTTTNLSQIPPYWIGKAKELLRLSYGHTSHGSQLVSGMETLASLDPLYSFNTDGAISADVLSLADGTPAGDLGNPDRATWAAETRTYLDGSGSDRNTVMWSWCGQADTSDPADIDTYLNLLNQLETDYPAVKFVYMTGHLAGTGTTGDLYLRNNQIRAYAQANHKVLFDFADIESYDPAGNYYPAASDACEWCNDWCNAHPGDCVDLPDSCAHSHPLNCLRKGQAFWWMMARLAGWNGVTQ